MINQLIKIVTSGIFVGLACLCMLFKEYRLGFKPRLHPINAFILFHYILDGLSPLWFPITL